MNRGCLSNVAGCLLALLALGCLAIGVAELVRRFLAVEGLCGGRAHICWCR